MGESSTKVSLRSSTLHSVCEMNVPAEGETAIDTIVIEREGTEDHMNMAEGGIVVMMITLGAVMMIIGVVMTVTMITVAPGVIEGE